MEVRNFSITLISANNLPNVRSFGSMKVYAKVSIRGIADTTYETSVDEAGGVHPKWNACFSYWLRQSALKQQQEGRLILDIELYCQRTLGDRYIGEVNLNLNKLFDIAASDTFNFTVKTSDGQATEGKLQFSYTFGGLETKDLKKKGESFLGKVIMEVATTIVVEGVSAVAQAMLSS